MLTSQSLSLTTLKRKMPYQSTYLTNSILLSNKLTTIIKSELLYLKVANQDISVPVLILNKDSINHLKTFNSSLPTLEEFSMISEISTVQSFLSSMDQP